MAFAQVEGSIHATGPPETSMAPLAAGNMVPEAPGAAGKMVPGAKGRRGAMGMGEKACKGFEALISSND